MQTAFRSRVPSGFDIGVLPGPDGVLLVDDQVPDMKDGGDRVETACRARAATRSMPMRAERHVTPIPPEMSALRDFLI